MFKEIINDYLSENSGEYKNFSGIIEQLKTKDEINLINRKNFIGHFTASTFVLSTKDNKILMIYHNFLKRYLQPGGHIETLDNSPLESAKRELFEETGIDGNLLIYKKANQFNDLVPFNIDIHKIPENKSKNEKSHYHYDLQYMFVTSEEIKANIDIVECSDLKWVDFNTFEQMKDYREICKKIKNMFLN